MITLWLPIKDWERKYEVSNKGEIRSLRHAVKKILKVRIHKRYNYRSASVVLHKDNIGKETQVSRCVALAFIPNPEGKKEVNHLDNNPLNNKVENLQWMTHAENMAYAKKQGRMHNGKKPLDLRDLVSKSYPHLNTRHVVDGVVH